MQRHLNRSKSDEPTPQGLLVLLEKVKTNQFCSLAFIYLTTIRNPRWVQKGRTPSSSPHHHHHHHWLCSYMSVLHQQAGVQLQDLGSYKGFMKQNFWFLFPTNLHWFWIEFLSHHAASKNPTQLGKVISVCGGFFLIVVCRSCDPDFPFGHSCISLNFLPPLSLPCGLKVPQAICKYK